MKNITELDLTRHPCFNEKVKGMYGRVHLPVAPRCNIKCNYCNRKYDCVNESRPGVTSSVLTPDQAVHYLEKVVQKEPRITVAGIAGPGDPFANVPETMETLRGIRKKFPDMILCLASNGLNLSPHVPELAEIGISHVTITMNSIDERIGGKIYSWVRDGKVVYRGIPGARLLRARQFAAIEALKMQDIKVKINAIVIPGINDHHILQVADKAKKLGVDLFNCMAMFPNPSTPFENVPEPSDEMIAAIRNRAEMILPQMKHCTRCRADAVGLLDDDLTDEMRGCLAACSSAPSPQNPHRPYVAVATQEGVLVNQHLGEATRFQVWEEAGSGDFRLMEERRAPAGGGGELRWHAISRLLSDCRAILVNDLGKTPEKILTEKGIKPVKMTGFIEQGLRAVYSGKGLHALQVRMRKCNAKGCCSGSGEGCG